MDMSILIRYSPWLEDVIKISRHATGTLALLSWRYKWYTDEPGVNNFHAILHPGFWDILPLNCLSWAKSSSRSRQWGHCAVFSLIACFGLLCLCCSWSFPGEMEQEKCQLFSNKPRWGCPNMGQKGKLRDFWAVCTYSYIPNTNIPLVTDKYWENVLLDLRSLLWVSLN